MFCWVGFMYLYIYASCCRFRLSYWNFLSACCWAFKPSRLLVRTQLRHEMCPLLVFMNETQHRHSGTASARASACERVSECVMSERAREGRAHTMHRGIAPTWQQLARASKLNGVKFDIESETCWVRWAPLHGELARHSTCTHTHKHTPMRSLAAGRLAYPIMSLVASLRLQPFSRRTRRAANQQFARPVWQSRSVCVCVCVRATELWWVFFTDLSALLSFEQRGTEVKVRQQVPQFEVLSLAVCACVQVCLWEFTRVVLWFPKIRHQRSLI